MAMNKLMIGLMGMIIMSKINLESDEMVNRVRIGYVVSCFYCTFGYFWIWSIINSKKDQTEIIVTPARDGTPARKQSKYDYDMSVLGEMVQSYVMGVFMMGMLHVQLAENKLLFFWGIYNPFMVVDNQLYRIHLLGESDGHGDLIRPWKPASMWGSGSGGGEQGTDSTQQVGAPSAGTNGEGAAGSSNGAGSGGSSAVVAGGSSSADPVKGNAEKKVD